MNAILEVAIGTVLVFLVMAVLVSSVTEIISGCVHMRSKTLEHGIAVMLGHAGKEWLYNESAVIKTTMPPAFGNNDRSKQKTRRPSYIDAVSFATALIDAAATPDSTDLSTPSLEAIVDGLAKSAKLSADASATIRALARRADGDIDQFRQHVEDWFDREMDRVSGAYGRWSQVVMVATGLALAVVLNVSSYTIGRALWVDPTLRAEVAAAAQQTVATPATTSTTTPPVYPTYRDLDRFGVPVGWNPAAEPNDAGQWLLHAIGWLVLAIAASFGAPFWFDTLTRFVNLRTSGPPPQTAASQRGSSP